MILNQWIERLHYWCPAQIYYYFLDKKGGRWCIYLRWRHDDPWTAELVRCDMNWEFDWNSPDNMDLLEEEEHTTGVITGYYKDDEYPFLEERMLKKVQTLLENKV